MKPIPYGKHDINEDDIKAVVEVLKSDYLTQGPLISSFEEKFSAYIGVKYSVAVANGTAALHLCALALNVKPGDKVITTPITFSASANCVRYCGGEVVFVDIDPKTFLIDIDKIENLLANSPFGTYKGIIPVDFAGYPVDMERLKKIADQYGCWIIEDACHAPGAFFEDSKKKRHQSGDGSFADLTIFSFHPVKHIASGEGGMITTNNEELYKKLNILRTHGITKEKGDFVNDIYLAYGGGEAALDNEEYPLWYMEMQTLGYNYRLTDFQAALGISQLSRAELGLNRRREIAQKYADVFENKSYIKNQSGFVVGHAYHLYIIEVDRRKALYDFLRANSIYAQVHYVPVHLMPYYRTLGWKSGDFPNAESYYKYCLSLPMFPTLSHAEQNYVIQKIDEFYK
jgi:UDP-4-amino-4,6-dideoxy-N-acetyl-beta-L-altrosamine transaminase